VLVIYPYVPCDNVLDLLPDKRILFEEERIKTYYVDQTKLISFNILENAINEHPLVVESAVVGFPHDIKGLGIYAFVICQPLPEAESVCRNEIAAVVSKIIGAIAKPDKIQFVSGLPKTRSGKIMRRILRKIAEGELQQLGDTTTLLDPSVVEQIIQGRL
jgi:acetyl-CoA synthetase